MEVSGGGSRGPVVSDFYYCLLQAFPILLCEIFFALSIRFFAVLATAGNSMSHSFSLTL